MYVIDFLGSYKFIEHVAAYAFCRHSMSILRDNEVVHTRVML